MSEQAGYWRPTIDNRVLLLGLDAMSRAELKGHESGELLHCARCVAQRLGLAEADAPLDDNGGKALSAEVKGDEDNPIEGYYDEDPRLSEYFRLMRALQGMPREHRDQVRGLPEFQRLWDVTTANIFGIRPADSTSLLPTRVDALFEAAQAKLPWTIPSLLERAHDRAESSGDISLVGLAALADDAIALAAVRESVVLYSARATLSRQGASRTFLWHVDAEFERRAAAFVREFNGLFNASLPCPNPSAAEAYYDAADDNYVLGRCVCIGQDERRPPWYYHWAICRDARGECVVQDFWQPEIWTTARFREAFEEGSPCPELGPRSEGRFGER